MIGLSSEPITDLRAGNFGQMLNPQGWEFHRCLVDTFGGIIKVQGLWGVGPASVRSTLSLISNGQDKQLYVTDPKALHHIIVKDQHVYEEPSWFIE